MDSKERNQRALLILAVVFFGLVVMPCLLYPIALNFSMPEAQSVTFVNETGEDLEIAVARTEMRFKCADGQSVVTSVFRAREREYVAIGEVTGKTYAPFVRTFEKRGWFRPQGLHTIIFGPVAPP